MWSLKIIQGGMGVAVSGWPLARAVSQLGQLGVVSGTGLAVVLARRLQRGDSGGHLRRALASFPLPEVAERVLRRYYVPGGKPGHEPYTLTSMPQIAGSAPFIELTVVANYVEVFLAKEGHRGVVGINYLEKIQIPTLPSLFGAMLAGVDYVLMGAGIPRFIPGALDALAAGKAAELNIDVEETAPGEHFPCRFEPAQFFDGQAPALRRPQFLAIISSATLAMTLARKSNGKVDGFIIEGPTAGGHNAPPRGPTQLNVRGEPIYGPRDHPDLDKIRELGLPFWMAGGFGSPRMLAQALEVGAAGIQVGSAFAFSRESGITESIKQRAIQMSRDSQADVFTDRRASPTGFPFKVLQVPGSLSEAAVYDNRTRICDIGYLRHPYRRADGTLGYRCPAEPEEQYVKKGGQLEDTVGRKCICNALFGTIGLGQTQASGDEELPLVTAGDDVAQVAQLVPPGQDSYGAADVLHYLLGSPAVPVAPAVPVVVTHPVPPPKPSESACRPAETHWR